MAILHSIILSNYLAWKARSYKPKSIEWNKSAIEVKKKKGRKRKFLPFHTPSTGPHQFQSPSQPKGKNENKGKKDSTPEGGKGIKISKIGY